MPKKFILSTESKNDDKNYEWNGVYLTIISIIL